MFNPQRYCAIKAGKAIAQGSVIGWFQGRAATGPRALGNRSILADPRKRQIKHYLNRTIKHREWFRPFGPAILAEKIGEYFECEEEFPYMLMLFAFPVKESKANDIPGALHVDSTARVQTVRKEDNEPFYRVIEFFMQNRDSSGYKHKFQ